MSAGLSTSMSGAAPETGMRRVGIQTLAFFVEAYRQLNSQKLFWITLALSGLLVIAMAMLGIDEDGVTFLHWSLGDLGGSFNSTIYPPSEFYKLIFVGLGVNVWLSWIAAILALISTAGIIPALVTGGSIEMTLSKPISRTRLFLTKYATGLVFSGIQVLVFSLAAFLVIGVRGGAWEWSVFLAVPLVVLMFSFLSCVCALLGLLTRSTITSLLLTLLFWFLLFLVHAGDATVVMLREMGRMRVEQTSRTLERQEAATTDLWQRQWIADWARANPPDGDVAQSPPIPPEPTAQQLDEADPMLAERRRELVKARSTEKLMTRISFAFVAVKTVLPKVQDTRELLTRTLTTQLNQPLEADASVGEDDTPITMQNMSERDEAELQRRIQQVFAKRGVWWTIGTSMLFQVVVLALACWIFSRRDF